MERHHSDDPHADGLEPFGAWEAALCRFEDVLLNAPFDQALPDLVDLLGQARVPLSLVEHDERARKLLGEAILARPVADSDVVRRARVRVELLTLEVTVLAERLRDPASTPEQVHVAMTRLATVHDEIERLRDRRG